MQPPPPQPYFYGSPVYQQPAPPRKKRRAWIWLLIGVISLLSLCICALLGPSLFRKPPDGYMNTEDSITVHILRYLHWTEANGQISGYWSIAEVKGNGKPTYGSGNLAGTQSGSEISLSFRSNIGAIDYTDTGTLQNNTLTLQAPMPDGTTGILVFYGVTQAQYEQELGNFKTAYGG